MSFAFDNLQGIGRIWANYGLNVGKVALSSSAEGLRAGAAFLDNLTHRIDEMKTQVDPAQASQPTDAPTAEQR